MKILNRELRCFVEEDTVERMERSLWGHLPLLMRSNSKDSVEYILQALWRTRKTGLDAADRDMLQLENDSDIDPVCIT